jgi:MSHA biogenesis protein MshI
LFAWLKRRNQLPGVAAVGLSADGVCVVHIARVDGAAPRIVAREFRPFDGKQSQAEVLAAVAADLNLARCRCATFLDESDYKLVLTEAPNVAPDELKAAVRWRVKDFINFHINDATIEILPLPETVRGATPELYVVAAQNAAIQGRIQLLETAGINVEIVDIPEMAQRNVAALLPEDQNGVALLSLTARGGLITLTRGGELYLSRPLATGLDVFQGFSDPTHYFDQVLLDIQRSLDYYESHFRQAPIRHLVLAPLPTEAPGLFEYLTHHLAMPVHQLDLSGHLDAAEGLSASWQAKHLTVIGAALRHEA